MRLIIQIQPGSSNNTHVIIKHEHFNKIYFRACLIIYISVSIPQGCEEVSQPTTTSTQCNCHCTSVVENKWSFIEGLNLTREEIKIMMKEELQQIRQNLTIDKTDTSAYMRTKISAPDDRMSSKSMGILGIILLTSVLMLVVGSDLLNAFKNSLFCHRKQF